MIINEKHFSFLKIWSCTDCTKQTSEQKKQIYLHTIYTGNSSLVFWSGTNVADSWWTARSWFRLCRNLYSKLFCDFKSYVQCWIFLLFNLRIIPGLISSSPENKRQIWPLRIRKEYYIFERTMTKLKIKIKHRISQFSKTRFISC